MKVGNVGVKHVGGYSIFVHDLWIGMAACANLRGFQAKGSGSWIFDIMDAMTVDARGDIQVILVHQG